MANQNKSQTSPGCWDYSKLSAQVLFIILTQVTKQYFFANTLPDATPFRFPIIMICVFLFRAPLVCASQLPEVFHDFRSAHNKKNKLRDKPTDDLVTNYFVEATTGQCLQDFFNSLPISEQQGKNRHSASGSVQNSPVNATAATALTALSQPDLSCSRRHELAVEKVVDKLNIDVGVNLSLSPATYVFRRQRRVGKTLGWMDGICSVPSTAFFVWFMFQGFVGKTNIYEDFGIGALGFAAGIYAALTYISFRVPRSVERLYVLEAAWKADNYSKIDLAMYRKCKAWASFTAIAGFFFVFYGAFATFSPVAKGNKTAYGFIMGISAICALLGAHTFYHNHIDGLMPLFIKRDPQTSSQAQKKADSISSTGEALAKTIFILGLSSILTDAVFSVRAMLSGLQTFNIYSEPSQFTWGLFSIYLVGAILNIAPTDRAIRFTLTKAVSSVRGFFKTAESTGSDPGSTEEGSPGLEEGSGYGSTSSTARLIPGAANG